MNVSKICPALILSAVLALPAFADQEPEGRRLASLGFASSDANEDGQLTMIEMLEYAELARVSMDADDNGTIDRAEFMGWDFGFSQLAEETGNVQGFETAQKFVFDFWDRNDDQVITAQEQSASMMANMMYAALDGSATLSEQEFLSGFFINIAYRAALKPE